MGFLKIIDALSQNAALRLESREAALTCQGSSPRGLQPPKAAGAYATGAATAR
jgi:hypothetical protein